MYGLVRSCVVATISRSRNTCMYDMMHIMYTVLVFRIQNATMHYNIYIYH